MGIKECCSTILAALPNPSLPLIPALIMGTFVSALMLLLFYKKYTNLPLKVILIHMLKRVLYQLPSHEHSEAETCSNPDCVRCSKYEELKVQIITKWKFRKIIQPIVVSERLEDAIIKLEKRMKSTPESDDGHIKDGKKKPYSFSQKPTLFYMNLAANPFWSDFDVFKVERELLKLNFSVIMKEFKTVFDTLKNGESFGWKLNDINMGHWCIFPFIDQGTVVESNCKRCPNVAGILGSLPSIMKDCVFGNACFCILYPDSYIKSHHGPSNLRLRCHLGLLIPEGCWLEVAGTQYKWKAQETVIFDDSFEHSATFTNQSNSLQASPRAVLMIDFWHPDVTQDEKNDLLELLAP